MLGEGRYWSGLRDWRDGGWSENGMQRGYVEERRTGSCRSLKVYVGYVTVCL